MSILSDEILNDPLGKGYSQYLPDQPGHVVGLLNAKTESKLGMLYKTDMTSWSVLTDMRKVIEDESLSIDSPLRSSALAILDVIRGDAASGIDFGKPINVQILDLWQYHSKLSVQDRSLMEQMATGLVSRMEILGLLVATEELLRNR